MTCDPGSCITILAIAKLVAGAAGVWASGYAIGVTALWVDRIRGAA